MVFITLDLSPQERQLQKNLRAKLHRQRSAGEQNLVMRKGQIISTQALAMDVTHSFTAITSTTAASVSMQ